MITILSLLQFLIASDLATQFYRSNCLNYGRCEKLISSVRSGDSSMIACLDSPDLVRIVRNPDSAAATIRRDLKLTLSSSSSLYWMGYVGLATGLHGKFQDSVLKVLSEFSPLLRNDAYIGMARSIGLIQYIYAVNRPEESIQAIRAFDGAYVLHWSYCATDSSIADWCRIAYQQLDSVNKWVPGIINMDSLRSSVLGGKYLGAFISGIMSIEMRQYYTRLGMDTAYARVLKEVGIPTKEKELMRLHGSCIHGIEKACRSIQEYASRDFPPCEDWLLPSILFRVVQNPTLQNMDSTVMLYAPRNARIGNWKLMEADSTLRILTGTGVREHLQDGYLGTTIVAESRHWFPQVEMPPAFFFWLYGFPSKVRIWDVEARVPPLLAIPANKQMACLKDTTLAKCGEIRAFVRETASWGGAKSAMNYGFLIRPLTQKPPGWE